MFFKKKTIFFVAGGIVVLAVAALLIKSSISANRFRSEIPVVSETEILSEEVRKQIAEAAENARKKPTAENLGILGMVYHASAKYVEAGKCYKLAVDRNINDWRWNYYRGYLNLEMGDSESAITDFKNVVQKNENAWLAWYYLGEQYKNLREYELAKQSFNKIIHAEISQSSQKNATRIDNFPLGTYARFQLSRIYVETDSLDMAEKISGEIIENSEFFGPAYRMLGTIFNLKGEKQKSDEFTTRAGDLVLFSPPVDTLIDKLVLMSRSELYLLKKIDEAERSVYSDWALRIINNGLDYLPENEYLLSKAIRIYLWKNQEKQAVALIDKHIQLLKNNAREMFKTGMFFYNKELFFEAKKYWTAASILAPDDVEIQKHLAICLWKLGEKEDSQKLLTELYASSNTNFEEMAEINYIMYHSGLKEMALYQLNELNKSIPTNAVILKLSGEIAEGKGELSHAIRLYEMSFAENPEDLKTIEYLGNLLHKKQLWNDYIMHYRKALEHHPNEPEILANLGTFLINCPDTTFRNITEGKKYTQRAFTHIESTPGILVSAGNHLAIAYYMLGDRKSALSTVVQTINIARRENMPQTFQTRLENLYRLIQQTEGG